MTYKETAEQARPDTTQIEKKISKWKNAKSAATNKIILCPDWLRQICYILPDKADHLLAWLIESHAYIGKSNDVILVHRSPTWSQLVDHYLFMQMRRDELFSAIRKALLPESSQNGTSSLL